MNQKKYYNFPSKIICLTEESVETLFLIGKSELISGVSAFVKRPAAATKLPKVSFFTSSNYDKIAALNPELIIGHSDIQKDIARDLIKLGYNVHIANHRSIEGILGYIVMLGSMVGAREPALKLVQELESKICEAKDFAKTLSKKPVVYFEEWDDPTIICIQWVCELLELCGARVLFSDKSKGVLAQERIISQAEVVKLNPDIIFGCWCGKKVKVDAIKSRPNWKEITAVAEDRVYELAPEIFLQPGPAPILDGVDILINYFKKWTQETQL